MRRPTAPQALSRVVGLSSWENKGDSTCTETPLSLQHAMLKVEA